MKKKWLAVLLASLMAFSVVACGSGSGSSGDGGQDTSSVSEEADNESGGSTAGTDNISYGKIPIDLAVQVHQADTNWQKTFSEEDGISVNIIDGQSDATVMNNAVEDLMVQGVDAIIITPQDTEAIIAVLEEAMSQGIHCMTYYRTIEGLDIPWIRVNEKENAYKMGVDSATKWKELYPDQPIKIGIVEFLTDPTTCSMRSEPFLEGVHSVDPDAEVVVSMDGNGSRETAVALGQDILQSHPEVNLIYGTSAAHSLGVLSAFEAAGRGKAIDGVPQTEIFVGTDASQDELIKLADPSCSLMYTMGMTPKDNARKQVDAVKAVCSGEIPSDEKTIIDCPDRNFSYYDDTPESIQEWFNDQYGENWDLVGELEKMK